MSCVCSLLCLDLLTSRRPRPPCPLRLADFDKTNPTNEHTQVGVVSLNGMISTNFVVDPVSIPDCDTLPTLFLAELKALAKQLGVLNEPLAAELLARTEEQNVRLNKFAVRAHA